MELDVALEKLPKTDKKVVVTHSGGMDSSTAVILAVEAYGANNVISVGYDYGQKQVTELGRATDLCNKLGVKRHVLDLSILGDVVRNVSANIGGTDIEMPTIKDILGNPQPPTYVPFRNAIIFNVTAAFAEANGASHIICGLQVHDEYSYWDTTQRFINDTNKLWGNNRMWPVELVAPFSEMSKTDEMNLLIDMKSLDLLEYTLTCYNPDDEGRSCGRCPSCSERIKGFMDIKQPDRVEYSIDIPWVIE